MECNIYKFWIYWMYHHCFSHSRCSIRFPSTSIRLFFQSLIDESEEFMDNVEMPESPEKMSPDMKPLTINIPHPETFSRLHGASPPSPTGTIRYGTKTKLLSTTNLIYLGIDFTFVDQYDHILWWKAFKLRLCFES